MLKLQSPNGKVILWGATVSDRTVSAEIAFIGSSIQNPMIPLSKPNSKTRECFVRLPDNFLMQALPMKGNNITLEIID
jgi:hypothetical protein